MTTLRTIWPTSRESLPCEVWLARTRVFDDLFVALGGCPAQSGYQMM